MASPPKTIIDLEPRCILEISKHLRLSDIVNVAEAFNMTETNVSITRSNDESEENETLLEFAVTLQNIFLKKSGGEWCIDNEKYVPHTIKTLRCFGSLISSLTVDYCKISAQECVAIDDAILANCRESLKMIALCYVHKNTLANINRPFESIKCVHIYGGFLNKRLSKFQRWFPKLSELDIEQVYLEKPNCIEHHFPHLTTLRISNENDFEIEDKLLPEVSCITDSNVKIAMQLNPQIKSLNLSDDAGGRDDFGICLSQKSLSFVQRKLLNLRHLKLTICYFDYQPFYKQNLLHFDFLKTLTLIVKDWSYLSKIQIASGRLRKLILESEDSQLEMRQTYEIISTFTKNNKNINCLFINSIHNDYDLYGDYVIGLVNDLRNLDELNIEFNWAGAMAADAIIHILKNCEHLKKFTVHWNDKMDMNKQQFMYSFITFADMNSFDPTIWDIDFNNCWSSSSSISFSKQNLGTKSKQ